MDNPSTTSLRVPAARRWLAVIAAGIGLLGVLLAFCLRITYAEFGRLIVGGLIAPAAVVMIWLALAGGVLLGAAPFIGG